MNPDDGYRMLAGKCKKICESIAAVDPGWRLVRGHYVCPFWGSRAHWWLESTDGVIYDPTVFQFPSSIGDYEEFDGVVECAECGKRMKEEDASFDSNYAFCSGECNMRFVGL